MNITEKLSALRKHIAAQGWSALIVTGTDPHDSEYLAPRWETRAWVTGFTGSAGTVVVTAERAGLWTDGRYFTQAEAELADSGVELFREGIPGTPTPATWMSTLLPKGATIGVDARTIPWSKLLQWREETSAAGLKVEAAGDPIEKVWTDRPGLPGNEIWDYEAAVSGLVGRGEKLSGLRQALRDKGNSAHLLTALDDLAWLFNLRGSDIDFTPVFLGWGLVTLSKAVLFVQIDRVSAATSEVLRIQGIDLKPYSAFETELINLCAGETLLVNTTRTNAHLVQTLKTAGVKLVEGPTPLVSMKARKSEAELALMREAHLRDGVALVEFLAWFDQEAPRETLTETGAADALDGFRQKQGSWRGPSFTAIPGFRENGAVIHYHAKDQGSALKGRGLFLLDTGAQYTQGTTDVTRTLVLGQPTAEEMEDYTLVLKAHVQLSLMPFPVGTRGYMIDAFARRVLWKKGRNYQHGTGHGVGHFLAVHEGLARINSEPIPIALEPGMILSNEPGLYRPGFYGIRIENLVNVVQGATNDFGRWLEWETLTLCPYERRLIAAGLLDADEKKWIDDYHVRVLEVIGPRVDLKSRDWLTKACAPL